MEPIPETAAAIEEFGKFYAVDLLGELLRKAEAVRELVPDLVGLSLASLDDGVAFTLVATDADVAVLDAVQYLDGGPCVDAPPAEQVQEYDAEDPDDERQWQSFAKATAVKGVATTLTLPVLHDEMVVGSVNLYAASSRAFDGFHREIADIFSAWAPGAVTNADLSFQTRWTAEQAPEVLRAAVATDMAIGLLMEGQSVGAETARRLLEEAAQRAGVPVEELAGALLEAHESADEDPV